MNDVETPIPAPDVAAGFGRRLAAERERRGLTVGDIAARLRLHPKQVAAIEDETLSALPAPFLRGFVRNYAKELQLDPQPLLADLNRRLPPASEEVHRGAAAGPPALPREAVPRRLVIAGGVGVLAVFALIGWYASRSEQVAQPAAPVPAPTPAVVAAPEPAPAPQPDTAAEATAAAPQPEPEPGDGVRLRFREQSWVEVTQGDGRVVFSQLNAAGTERRIDGKPPLRLVIGNASGVDVEYKGKPVELKPVTSSENVARITLN